MRIGSRTTRASSSRCGTVNTVPSHSIFVLAPLVVFRLMFAPNAAPNRDITHRKEYPIAPQRSGEKVLNKANLGLGLQEVEGGYFGLVALSAAVG